jgi:hypothetical protein
MTQTQGGLHTFLFAVAIIFNRLGIGPLFLPADFPSKLSIGLATVNGDSLLLTPIPRFLGRHGSTEGPVLPPAVPFVIVGAFMVLFFPKGPVVVGREPWI